MRLGVMTSGGDSPGMNAAIRAVVRTAIHQDMGVVGIMRGFLGIACDAPDVKDLDTDSVSNILQRGGTILKSGRCPEMLTEEGRERAAAHLREAGVDVLLAIGGNGTMQGLQALLNHWNGGLILLPGTIDNDCGGTDYTIGYDTALNTALDSIDRIRDTAEAFDRVFLVEVMGRHCGALAVGAAIAGGAEEVIIPETPTDLEALARRLIEGQKLGRGTSIVVVSEHDDAGNAPEIAGWLGENYSIDTRVCVLGHTQRGGRPTADDRILASRLGVYAVRLAQETQGRVAAVVGVRSDKVVTTPLAEAVKEGGHLDPGLADLVAELSR
ncbi:MAG: ATP-dependent 6-phosphofructokinase [Armatimonadia bacterium]|nr:ATP-dependent 6-phosphofructokinase [Armatimonadia bacterium]